jgi:DMSO/TMAO reductase YedYZ molybdopterin-dependent catalytic subunit
MKIKNLHTGIFLLVILAIVGLVISCAQLPSSSDQTGPPTDIASVIYSDPAKVDNSKLPITPVNELNVTGSAPEVDIAKYRLTVDGLVNTPLTLTYEAFTQYPTVSDVVLLICSGIFADNAQWTGVPVATLLAEAGIKPQAEEVTFYALDGYKQTLSVEEVQNEGVFLAHTVDGQTLPKEHGYPVRLVVKGKYGSSWVKWVSRIEVW